MPNSQGEALFRLISSLSKSEKRNFSLYAKRIQGEGEIKFLQLFDLMEKQTRYEEGDLREKLGRISKSQFTNLRRNLYQHILTSLRLIEINKRRDFQVRELIDYAHILYGKGLYLQALKLLHKAKSIAMALHQDLLHLEILEFEKRIQSRHITRSSTQSINKLMDEATHRQVVNTNLTEWSNLKLRLQRLFINKGHLSGPREKKRVTLLMEKFCPEESSHPTFFEKVYRCESLFWQYYLTLDLPECLHYAENWVDLFRQRPTMIARDKDMYLRGINHLLTISFYLSDHRLLRSTLDELESFCLEHEGSFNPNSRILAFLFRAQGRLNQYFLSGNLSDGVREVLPFVREGLREYGESMDKHKVMILHYKLAWLQLGRGAPDEAIDLLRPITEQRNGHLRDELLGFSHIMFLMAHYELGNYDLFPYLLQVTQTVLDKMKRPGTIPTLMVRFFRKAHRLDPIRSRDAFTTLKKHLTELSAQPELRREFIFLNALIWVKSILGQCRMEQIVKDRHRDKEGIAVGGRR